MNVSSYIHDTVKQRGMHMTLIDPDKQEPSRAAEIGRMAADLGTDAIMVGGSTGVTQENLDATVKAIKSVIDLPVIYFPSGAHAISPYSDAIYFMTIMNSRDARMIMGEQIKGAPFIKKMGLETISMGYVIVDPGMKVGQMAKAELVERDDIMTAMGYALTAEFLGMSMVYFEAGSGAPEPVPSELIGAIKKATSIPVVIGGGIRDPKAARMVRDAGADVVVTGTLVEGDDFTDRLKGVIEAVRR